MTAAAHAPPRAGRRVRRRWATLLGLSAVFHALVLSAFAVGMPAVAFRSDLAPMDVSLVDAPPFVRPQLTPAAQQPEPPPVRAIVLGAAPRFVAPETAATGEAGDAVDLFGPVFADGRWPRPVVVRSDPCEPEEDPERAAACRRELLLIGLASEPRAGSKAQP
jgi:hypothetical protein